LARVSPNPFPANDCTSITKQMELVRRFTYTTEKTFAVEIRRRLQKIEGAAAVERLRPLTEP
jgi:hypothetical protein